MWSIHQPYLPPPRRLVCCCSHLKIVQLVWKWFWMNQYSSGPHPSGPLVHVFLSRLSLFILSRMLFFLSRLRFFFVPTAVCLFCPATASRGNNANRTIKCGCQLVRSAQTRIMRERVEQAWRLMWLSLLGCAAARAFAASFLELCSSAGAGGLTPLSTKWKGDFRGAWLACDPG